jgi:hypothetical protein
VNRALTYSVVLAGLSTLALTCGPLFNKDPVIVHFNVPDTVEANATVPLVSFSTDPDGDSLGYAWTCSNGTLSDSSIPAPSWYAPMVSGEDTITLTVTDGRGGSAKKTAIVVVKPTTFTIAWWFGTIAAGEYNYWWMPLEAGCRSHGSFSVDSLDISFLVLDDADFNKWKHGETYRADVEIRNSAGASFTDTAKVRSTYYFVLDNTAEAKDKYAHIRVDGTTP